VSSIEWLFVFEGALLLFAFLMLFLVVKGNR